MQVGSRTYCNIYNIDNNLTIIQILHPNLEVESPTKRNALLWFGSLLLSTCNKSTIVRWLNLVFPTRVSLNRFLTLISSCSNSSSSAFKYSKSLWDSVWFGGTCGRPYGLYVMRNVLLWGWTEGMDHHYMNARLVIKVVYWNSSALARVWHELSTTLLR
jgi:hypothetical protein